MSIANEIIQGQTPDFDEVIRLGETLDDIDEYGFTPLIECAIADRLDVAQLLLTRGADVNKADVSGRTALHWAVDNNNLKLTHLLLEHRANPNAYTRAGMPVLVYPLLRAHTPIKQLLYEYGAKLDFAYDFIYAKLLGHRFSLKGDVDIVNADDEFFELDYEGFILEFTVAILLDTLHRFTSSYSTKRFRAEFPYLYPLMDAIGIAEELLRFQHFPTLTVRQLKRLETLVREAPMLVLPAASRGHAMCFVRYGEWWAKIDRGENSLKEGSVNIYRITRPQAFNVDFLKAFLYQKQPRSYFHQRINVLLGLEPVAQLPISSQTVGNCSWANIQAVVPVARVIQELKQEGQFVMQPALDLYHAWVEWDKDRALDECIQRFYQADVLRRASITAILGAILFQSCSDRNEMDLARAEKILKILTLPEYGYILHSYLQIYCVDRLTRHGNNLLKILDDCGVNARIDVTPIATGLKEDDSDA